jgi:hypothetical protein
MKDSFNEGKNWKPALQNKIADYDLLQLARVIENRVIALTHSE